MKPHTFPAKITTSTLKVGISVHIAMAPALHWISIALAPLNQKIPVLAGVIGIGKTTS